MKKDVTWIIPIIQIGLPLGVWHYAHYIDAQNWIFFVIYVMPAIAVSGIVSVMYLISFAREKKRTPFKFAVFILSILILGAFGVLIFI
jgi:undecaprenyl pyrophosphate phosphatase UppP